jgi:hypothetical protein
MHRFIFKVTFVERGQEALWRGWGPPSEIRGLSERARRPIGQCELIEAHHIEEAVQIIQRRYPDCTVMRSGSEKVCSA